ncbi:MAG TPA: glycosyltransferase family 2 protein [Candidatus Elarobacter sp.]|nr:glycosyltransferase family 2 protein [Candidatus Elarobacter sp.]HEV2740939.1 glycosyltransferase family 2 protein [Candidatus Elarobacter sp.]
MLLSIVIPAHNEQGSISSTVDAIAKRLGAADIAFEIVVVDDHSSDGTMAAIAHAAQSCPAVRGVPNLRERGFGNAIHTGLDAFRGDAVCIVMADASDDVDDIVAYWRAIERGYDCAFGSRFTRKATVVEYPLPKLLLNRFANAFVALLFGMRYNDITNAFKCYRREVIDGVRPVLSHHFNITVELPLKAIVRGYSWTVVPTNWYNRKHGVSKFNIKEMGSRYLFIVLYVLIERWLSRGDYERPPRFPGSAKADLPAPRSEAAAP